MYLFGREEPGEILTSEFNSIILIVLFFTFRYVAKTLAKSSHAYERGGKHCSPETLLYPNMHIKLV